MNVMCTVGSQFIFMYTVILISFRIKVRKVLKDQFKGSSLTYSINKTESHDLL